MNVGNLNTIFLYSKQ